MLVNPAFSRKHPLDLNNWLHKLCTCEICTRHSPFSEQTDTGNTGQTKPRTNQTQDRLTRVPPNLSMSDARRFDMTGLSLGFPTETTSGKRSDLWENRLKLSDPPVPLVPQARHRLAGHGGVTDKEGHRRPWSVFLAAGTPRAQRNHGAPEGTQPQP
jgi:hypothetical protein